MIHKKRFIKDLKKDEFVEDVFLVRFKKPVEPYKNGYKFELRLGDSSREIMFKLWGSNDEPLVKRIYDEIALDDFVMIRAKVNEWNSNLELSSNDLSAIQIIDRSEIDMKDFIKSSGRDVDDMYLELETYMDSVKDHDLREFLNFLFSDKELIHKFKNAPASMYKHHNWVGGLLEHTLNVISISLDILKVHDTLDRDLTLTGAIIHDIGKIDEFRMGSGIKVSDEGMLVGHISQGLEIVTRILSAIKIDKIKVMKLKHIILSHHGELEYGSPKRPAFPEALLIHYADEIDAKISSMQRAKSDANTEDNYIYTKDFENVFLR